MSRFKDFAKDISSTIFKYVFSTLGTKKSIKMLERICVAANLSTDYYVNFTIYPKKAEKYTNPVQFTETIEDQKIGIVIQGPVLLSDDFTLETVKLYKKLFPNAYIVVSTWENTKHDVINRIKELNADVVLSPLPKFSGIGNINYQVISTRAGLEKALEKGCVYVAKTRSDQRITKCNVFDYLINQIKTMHINHDVIDISQQERLCVLSGTRVGSSFFILGYISDFFYFGNTKDVLHYFSIDMQEISMDSETRKIWLKEHRNKDNLAEYFKTTSPETMLYMNHIGNTENNSLEKYWSFLKDYCICVSWADLGLFWYKYDDFVMTNKLYGTFAPENSEKRQLCYDLDKMNIAMIEQCKDIESFKAYSGYSAKIIEGDSDEKN